MNRNRTLFDQSYDDFKSLYFSGEMQEFIRNAYQLKKRCARLAILTVCSLLFTWCLYSVVYVNLSIKFTGEIYFKGLFIGGFLVIPLGLGLGSLFDRKISIMSYQKYYVDFLSGLYSKLLNTSIQLQADHNSLYNSSPFRRKQKTMIKTRNKGFSLSYGNLTAQMCINTATRPRVLWIVLRNIGHFLWIYMVIFSVFGLINRFTGFSGWMITAKDNPFLHSTISIVYLQVLFLLMFLPFGCIFYKILTGLTSSYLSISGIRSIDIWDTVIWITRRNSRFIRANEPVIRSFSLAQNKLRFNRIDLNWDFDVSVQVGQGTNLTIKMQDAKVIINPLVEDLLSYINKKYIHFDIAISGGRVDIQFLDDRMRKKNKVLNQLMNPVLFGRKDLYIENMYRFYEIVELVKLFSKYFYCGEEVERVTAEERALLHRSVELEKIPVSHFKRNNKTYFRKIIKGNK